MFTYKFVGLAAADAATPYYYGSLPAKPELGRVLLFEESGNRYAVIRIEGEGVTGDGPFDQREMALAWADISRGESVPTLWLQKLDVIETRVQGRSFSAEEVKEYSQKNRETRLSASAN
jgi:hypothetical protein